MMMIMMECVIAPLIFVLVMDMLLRSTKDTTSKKTVPSMKGLMVDVTVISESKSHMEELLKRLQELSKWAVLKINPSKSFSLSIIKGRCQEIKFAINDNVIPNNFETRKKPRSQLFPPTYWSSSVARLLKQLKHGLLSIENCDHIAKGKLWCVYFHSATYSTV